MYVKALGSKMSSWETLLTEGRDPLQCTTSQIPWLAGRTKFDRKNVSYLLEGFGITKGCAGNEKRVCHLSPRELLDCPGRNTHFFVRRGLKRVCFDLEKAAAGVAGGREWSELWALSCLPWSKKPLGNFSVDKMSSPS